MLSLMLGGIFVSCHELYRYENTSVVETHSIEGYKTIMPQSNGYDAFETNCITCHSLRYIQMQPDFSQMKWESIVDKMVRTFGAQIPDTTAKRIVDYLTNVKGVK